MVWPTNPHYAEEEEEGAEAEDIEDEEGLMNWIGEFEWCNYQGWRYKMMWLELNIKWGIYTCALGVHDAIFNSGKTNCATSTFEIGEAREFALLPMSAERNGMYDMDWNINDCQENPRFTARDGVARSLLESFKGDTEEETEQQLIAAYY